MSLANLISILIKLHENKLKHSEKLSVNNFAYLLECRMKNIDVVM